MMNKKMPKVWAILEGPTPISQLELLEDDEEAPEGAEIHLLCKVEVNGEFTEANFWFESADEVHEWVKYFKTSIDALEIETIPDGPMH
jgi:hypothetical protein